MYIMYIILYNAIKKNKTPGRKYNNIILLSIYKVKIVYNLMLMYESTCTYYY